MQDMAYTKHTYKHTTIGFLADIKDMPNQYAYSKTFFDRWYRPENCTIVVAGDVDHDELVALVRKRLRRLGAGQGDGRRSPPSPRRPRPRSATLTWPVPTLPILYLGYHIPAADPTNPDIAALGALAQAVFGETSPLYKALVLEEQKVVTARGRGRGEARPRPVHDLGPGPQARGPADGPEADRGGPGRGGQDADRRRRGWTRSRSHLRYAFAGSLDSPDAVAMAVGESIAIDRPARRDERPLRRLRPADPRRPPARRRPLLRARPTRRW